MNILDQYMAHKLEQNLIAEGVNDPAIFKVVFLAGGPGSGKSFIVGKTALAPLGFTVVNSDLPFEHIMKKRGLDFKMPDSEKDARDIARDVAKATAAKKLELSLNGRLGMVIDGTGKDYDKIIKQRTMFAALGYDSAMIFVNTNLDTALARNKARARSVPDEVAKKGWQEVQDNLGKFQLAFGNHFHIIDNSEGSKYEEQTLSVYKKIAQWSKAAPVSAVARAWFVQQRAGKSLKEESGEQNVE